MEGEGVADAPEEELSWWALIQLTSSGLWVIWPRKACYDLYLPLLCKSTAQFISQCPLCFCSCQRHFFFSRKMTHRHRYKSHPQDTGQNNEKLYSLTSRVLLSHNIFATDSSSFPKEEDWKVPFSFSLGRMTAKRGITKTTTVLSKR